jgi:hypothetical protein
MQYRFICLLAFTALAITSLSAGPVAISPAQLGVQTVSGLTQNNAGICGVIPGCGGAFSATVAGTPNVTMWCVDSQLFDTPNYTANIVSLNTPDVTFDNGTQVRYGSVASHNTLTSPHWLYDISGIAGVTNADEALTRYRLAAVLITMYDPQGAPTDASDPNNDHIQRAIWDLTENTSISIGQAGTNGQPSLGALESAWITTAAGMLGGFNFGGWAVASGAYDGVSHSLLGPPNAVQTYLVEVTPEPRFYGLLLAGLLSLCGMIYRRRVASN